MFVEAEKQQICSVDILPLPGKRGSSISMCQCKCQSREITLIECFKFTQHLRKHFFSFQLYKTPVRKIQASILSSQGAETQRVSITKQKSHESQTWCRVGASPLFWRVDSLYSEFYLHHPPQKLFFSE